MDNKAFYKLSYGVYMLSTKDGERCNGCIINTCIQVANAPTRVSVSLMNTNFTCGMIKESGVFAVSVLDDTVTFETIKHWGFQSGRDVDKMKGLSLPTDVNGVPYLDKHSCAILSCKVLESHELGTHTLFIAEVVDAKVTSTYNQLTYADYQSKVKPKPKASVDENKDKKIVGWRCRICGYVYESTEIPDDFICPICGHPKEDFEPIYE